MSKSLPSSIASLLRQGLRETGPAVFLTGAGISAESGIPTFRGPEGYWKVGSVNYQPQELATHSAFDSMPNELWGWYLYRRSACQKAQPNPAHRALAELEPKLEDKFLLLTQNVDGLHLRAGNSRQRTFEIHGNIDYFRREGAEDEGPFPLPPELPLQWPKGQALDAATRKLLTGNGGGKPRPHVLWFDECYNEEYYRFDSSIKAAEQACLLVIVGTSGQTNLPMQVGRLALMRQIPLVVINQDPSPFTEMADASPKGAFLQGKAGDWVPPLAECCADLWRQLG